MFLDPFYSVVHFPFYREVPRKSFGKALGYLLYLGLFFSIVSTIALYVKLTPVIHDASEWAAASIPTITIADGKASSPLTTPLLLRYPREPRVAFIIDTHRTTPVTAQEMRQQEAAAYLTQASLYVAAGRNKVEQYDLTTTRNAKPVMIDANFFREAASTLPKIFYPIAWISAWLIFFVWKLIAALAYSIVALILNAIASADLAYENLLKLSLYAQTPVIALQAVALFMPQRIFGFWLIALLIVSVYLWQAIRQNQPEQSRETDGHAV